MTTSRPLDFVLPYRLGVSVDRAARLIPAGLLRRGRRSGIELRLAEICIFELQGSDRTLVRLPQFSSVDVAYPEVRQERYSYVLRPDGVYEPSPLPPTVRATRAKPDPDDATQSVRHKPTLTPGPTGYC